MYSNGYLWPFRYNNNVLLWSKGLGPTWKKSFHSDEPNFVKSDGESDWDKLAHIAEDESNYFSQSSTKESGDKSDMDIDSDDSENAAEESNAARSSVSSGNTQSMQWHKRQPLFYDVIFKGEPLICADPDEMDMYFGVLVMMSIIKFPQIKMYWLRETRVPLWQMSCWSTALKK